MRKLLSELQTILSQHNNLVSIIEYELTDLDNGMAQLRVLTEYYNGGDLLQHMKKVTTAALPARRLRPTLLQMCRLMLGPWDALKFLHRNNLVHGDLKPENVLVRHGARTYSTGYEAAIGDLDAIAMCDTEHQRRSIWYTPQTKCYSADAVWGSHCDGRSDQVAMLLVTLEFLSSTPENHEKMDWFTICCKGPFDAAHLMSVTKQQTQQTKNNIKKWETTVRDYIISTLSVIGQHSNWDVTDILCFWATITHKSWAYEAVHDSIVCMLSALGDRKGRACS